MPACYWPFGEGEGNRCEHEHSVREKPVILKY